MADRFVTERKSQTDAINELADRSEKNTAAVTSNATTTNRTMTAAEVLSGLFVNAANGALALTLPTAAAMFAAMPNAQVGSKVFCWIVNTGDNTITFTTNTGLTITAGHGTATLATALSQLLCFEVVTSTTMNVYPVLKAGQ